jgi:hypothetical protein
VDGLPLLMAATRPDRVLQLLGPLESAGGHNMQSELQARLARRGGGGGGGAGELDFLSPST